MNRRDFLRRTSALTAVAAVAPAALLTQSPEPVAESAAYQMTAIHLNDAGAGAVERFIEAVGDDALVGIWHPSRHVRLDGHGHLASWGDVRGPSYGWDWIANRTA